MILTEIFFSTLLFPLESWVGLLEAISAVYKWDRVHAWMSY